MEYKYVYVVGIKLCVLGVNLYGLVKQSFFTDWTKIIDREQIYNVLKVLC